MKIAFMGTGPFAAKALSALIGSDNEVVICVTQPDRPNSRRGSKIIPGEVKVLAEENGIEVYQPVRVSSPESAAYLKDRQADLAVVCSYGQLLKKNILFETFRCGCINIHASLLESYRGAAPINRVIMDGRSEAGVTIMYMDEGLDTGDMMIRAATPISDEDTFGTLSERLSDMGGELAVKAIAMIAEGTAPRTPQDDALSNYAEKILKEDKHVSFDRPARTVFNHIRGMNPSPAAECTFAGKTVKLFDCEISEETGSAFPAGTVVKNDKKGIYVQCSEGVLLLRSLKPEGKGLMQASAFYNGIKDKTLLFS